MMFSGQVRPEEVELAPLDGPRGSKSPFHASRTGPYCVENVRLSSSTYASTETSTTFEKPGWATWQW